MRHPHVCFAYRVEYTDDVSRGAWIAPLLGRWGTATSVVPQGFGAYARVFHRVSLDSGSHASSSSTTWVAVAEAFGTTVHAAMQWERITRGAADKALVKGRAIDPPQKGELDQQSFAGLIRRLPQGQCTIGVWAGRGSLRGAPGIDNAISQAIARDDLLKIPGRKYVLLTGRTEELVDPDWAPRAGLGEPGLSEMPNLIWPDDRSWFIGSEIDFDSSIVASSAEVIEALTQSADLEVLRLDPTTDLSSEGDLINHRV